jgi:Ni,Fe-hydrogenase III small subunit/ferredoxin
VSLIKSLRVRVAQGSPVIKDLRAAVPSGFRGLPVIKSDDCEVDCVRCKDACPTQAISVGPVRLDLGACVFCNACADGCPVQKISFNEETRMGSSRREDLLVTAADSGLPPIAAASVASIFGRSLKLRQVSAGGCNACELELNAVANVNFDLQRYGVEWVASPRHADALVVTGPLTSNMRQAIRLAWESMPAPKFVVAVGACAISGGLYRDGDGVDRAFFEQVGPSLFVPGCPPHPLTFIHAILDFLGVH